MSNFVLRLLQMSAVGGALILVVAALRLLLKRAPKWAVMLLWAVVGIRLLCPLFISSSFGLLPSFETAGERQTVMNTSAPEPFYTQAPANTAESTKAPAQTEANTEAPAKTAIPAATEKTALTTEAAPDVTQAAASQLTAAPHTQAQRPVSPAVTGKTDTPAKSPFSWQRTAFIVWLAGACAFAAFALVRYIKLKARLATAVRLNDNVFESEFVTSPFLLGIISPRIYIPYGLEGKRLDYVLAHERAHIKRGDHVWKLIGFIILGLHWFDPLCWLGYALFCRDIEAACDERVVSPLSATERADYSEALLSFAERRKGLAVFTPAFVESGAASRIKRVISYKKPAAWALAVCLVLSLFLVGCSLLTGKNGSEDPAQQTADNTPAPTAAATEEPTEETTETPTEIPTAQPGPLVFADPAFEQCVRQQLDLDEEAPIERAEAEKLTRLVLGSEGIMSLEDLDKFPNVTWITLETSADADLSGLAQCKKLDTLWIGNEELEDISFASGLERLKLFHFGCSEGVDLTPLAGLKRLETLYINAHGAADITPLAELKLKELTITNMPQIDTDTISRIKSLSSLNLDNCGLTEMDFVSELTNLELLEIGNNYVEDITPLDQLTRLAHFNADNNFISDISPLFGLSGLEYADLSWNPVSREDIEALRKVHIGRDFYAYSYPSARERLACWPIDLDGDGEDEYFYADLELMTEDFISFAWLENKEHHRISNRLYYGTGHVAIGSFALVESPEYGLCIMSTAPEFYGQYYGYTLYKYMDGMLRSVYSETFYNYNDEGENSFDPAEAAAYEQRVNALYASGRLLISTDNYGLIYEELGSGSSFEVINESGIACVICSYGSAGNGIALAAQGEHAKSFKVFDTLVYSRVNVKPFTGE